MDLKFKSGLNGSQPSGERKKRPPAGLTRLSGLHWGIFFLVSAWMFGLGIFVGRQTAPIQFDMRKLEKELIVKREAEVMEEIKQFEQDTKDVQNKSNFEFHDKLRDTREEVRPEPLLAKKDDPKKPARSPSKTVKDDIKSRPKKAARTVKPSPRPVKKKSDPPVKSSPKRKKTIQVASFRDIKMADRHVKELLDKGYDAYRSDSGKTAKGRWYRVCVGSYKRSKDAAATMARLKKEKIKPIIINK